MSLRLIIEEPNFFLCHSVCVPVDPTDTFASCNKPVDMALYIKKVLDLVRAAVDMVKTYA